MTINSIFGKLFAVAILVIAIDFLGFTFWALSNQNPPDNYFVGTITYHFLKTL